MPDADSDKVGLGLGEPLSVDDTELEPLGDSVDEDEGESVPLAVPLELADSEPEGVGEGLVDVVAMGEALVDGVTDGEPLVDSLVVGLRLAKLL